MEPLDGLEFTRLIRTDKNSPNPMVPIILLTGHTEMSRVVEARDTGINEFLAKPISARGLYSRICMIIEDPRAFVRTDNYFGPDRRHQSNSGFGGVERRKADAEADDFGL